MYRPDGARTPDFARAPDLGLDTQNHSANTGNAQIIRWAAEATEDSSLSRTKTGLVATATAPIKTASGANLVISIGIHSVRERARRHGTG